jgi:hypothetical protein
VEIPPASEAAVAVKNSVTNGNGIETLINTLFRAGPKFYFYN